MNWDMIEHICVSIAVVGAALTYMYKGYKFAKKPADDVAGKLDNDDKRIKDLKKQNDQFAKDIDYISKSLSVLMRSNLAILGHLSTNNNNGEMAKMEKEIQDFLINN